MNIKIANQISHQRVRVWNCVDSRAEKYEISKLIEQSQHSRWFMDAYKIALNDLAPAAVSLSPSPVTPIGRRSFPMQCDCEFLGWRIHRILSPTKILRLIRRLRSVASKRLALHVLSYRAPTWQPVNGNFVAVRVARHFDYIVNGHSNGNNL